MRLNEAENSPLTRAHARDEEIAATAAPGAIDAPSASLLPTARPLLPANQERAALLVAADLLTGDKIAAEVGVSPATIDRWKTLPEFRLAVAEHAAVFVEAARQEGIARIETRVASQNARWRGLQAVIDARAADMKDECPGGSSGLLTRQVRFVKVFVPTQEAQERLEAGAAKLEELPTSDFIATKQTQAVLEYGVDTGLLAAISAVEAQAAKELGQTVDRSLLESKIDFAAMSDAELEQFALKGKLTR